jgi:hypothetical protein
MTAAAPPPSPARATGLWRAGPAAQRREVVIGFSATSLVLSDGRSDVVLAHWALSALVRLNPNRTPALYAPEASDEGETLEIAAPDAVARIEALRRRIAERRPRPGRLRLVLFVLMATSVALFATLWLPAAVVRHTSEVVPPASRAAIGRAALADLGRLTGPPCDGAMGRAAADKLALRLFGPDAYRIEVLREGLGARGMTAHLPGGLLLVDRGLIENHDTPEILAGHLLAEALRAESADPLPAVLDEAGLTATTRLLTTGSLPEGALGGLAESFLTRASAEIDSSALAARFAAAGVRADPYARAVRPDDPTLAAADISRTEPARLILPDNDWVALQGICMR